MSSEAELLLLVESRKKSGVVAALLNLFLPGAGYVYCGRWILGIFAFFFVIVLLLASFGFAAIGIVLMLIIDGFLCAGRYNKDLVKDIIRQRASEEKTSSMQGANLSSGGSLRAQDTIANQASRSCPECGETVLAVARKCKHCGSAIVPIASAT